MANHLLGWSPCLLRQVLQQNNVSLLLPFTSLLQQTARSFSLPYNHVSELGAVRHSDGLLRLLNLAFFSFRSLCFKCFLPVLQLLSPSEKKVVSFVNCSLIHTVQFFAMPVSFSNYFFKQIYTKTKHDKFVWRNRHSSASR
jgi:hypothetical protein